MMTTTQTHPDFLKTLSATQRTWCADNGITVEPGDRGFGFFFSKGDLWIEPVSAVATGVYLMKVDNSEDGDGATCVDRVERLRDALRALAAA